MKDKDLELLAEAYDMVVEFDEYIEAEPLEGAPKLSMNMFYKRANRLIGRKLKKNPYAGVDAVINLIKNSFYVSNKKDFINFFKKVETNAKIEDTIHSKTFVETTQPILKERLKELKLM